MHTSMSRGTSSLRHLPLPRLPAAMMLRLAVLTASALALVTGAGAFGDGRGICTTFGDDCDACWSNPSQWSKQGICKNRRCVDYYASSGCHHPHRLLASTATSHEPAPSAFGPPSAAPRAQMIMCIIL